MENVINNLKQKLNEFVGLPLLVTQSGFLPSRFVIQKMNFEVEYDILNITDDNSQSYIKINLNQIYNVDILDAITIFMDNDVIVNLQG